MQAVPLPRLHELRVERHGAVRSTQDLLRERLSGGRTQVHGLVIRASAQQAGRGQRDRSWLSGPGGSYQTAGFSDPAGAFRSGATPLAVAVGIAEELAAAGIPVALKWPNDLYLSGSRPDGSGAVPGKLGGILCEHTRSHLLVGVGVNVGNEAPGGSAVLPGGLEADAVSDIVLAGILRGLGEVLPDPGFAARYARFDLLAGLRVSVERSGGRETGVVAGVSNDGCLLLTAGAGGATATPSGASEAAERTVRMCSGRIVWIDAAA